MVVMGNSMSSLPYLFQLSPCYFSLNLQSHLKLVSWLAQCDIQQRTGETNADFLMEISFNSGRYSKCKYPFELSIFWFFLSISFDLSWVNRYLGKERDRCVRINSQNLVQGNIYNFSEVKSLLGPAPPVC